MQAVGGQSMVSNGNRDNNKARGWLCGAGVSAAKVMICAVMLMVTMSAAVKAAQLPDGPEITWMLANIVDVDEARGLVTVRAMAFGERTFRISDDTIIVDAVSGMGASLNERVNDAVMMLYADMWRDQRDRLLVDALAIEVNLPSPVRLRGNIVGIDEAGLVTVRPEAGGLDVLFNITDETFIVDAASGMNTSLTGRMFFLP